MARNGQMISNTRLLTGTSELNRLRIAGICNASGSLPGAMTAWYANGHEGRRVRTEQIGVIAWLFQIALRVKRPLV